MSNCTPRTAVRIPLLFMVFCISHVRSLHYRAQTVQFDLGVFTNLQTRKTKQDSRPKQDSENPKIEHLPQRCPRP